MFMPRTSISIANDVEHGVEINQKSKKFINESLMLHVNHNSLFLNLCDSFDNDGMLPNYS